MNLQPTAIKINLNYEGTNRLNHEDITKNV